MENEPQPLSIPARVAKQLTVSKLSPSACRPAYGRNGPSPDKPASVRSRKTALIGKVPQSEGVHVATGHNVWAS
jgi:hypothetical protein